VDSFTLKKVEFDAVRTILAGFCRCSLGRSLALRIGPSRNPAVIQSWLEHTSQMVRAIRDIGIPPLGGVTDITAALGRARPGGPATGQDFAAIADTLEAAAAVRAYLNTLPEDFGEPSSPRSMERAASPSLPPTQSSGTLRELASGIADFSSEIKAIRSIVGPDGNVLDQASMRLTELRKQIAAASQHIHDVIYGYLHQPEVAKLLQNVTVTLHGDRFVLPVKQENRGRLSGVVHRESNTGATVFVEPNACVELNNLLTDLREDERREIQRLLSQLSLRVQARAVEIAAALRSLAQVDLLAAKAQYAYQMDMTAPEMAERGPLLLTQARHPLLVDQAWRQEKAGVPPEKRHGVVPIDVRLGQDFDLLVLTGSNTGGKTVTLKTVALLALMAQSGMHIPAQRGARLPIFRDVFIDIGDEQSLQQSLSTFGAHIKRIRYILHKADKSSLVLLDELGAGTDPEEGGAIGQAVLDEMLRIGCLGMATTHLSVLKAYAYTHDRVDNASVEFNTETLCPTYHLRIGTPGESHAIIVAQHLGLPKRIVGAARQHLSAQGKQFRRAIKATSLVRQAAEEARSEAQAAQRTAQEQQEAYEQKLADLHRLRGEFDTWLARLPELKSGDEVFVPSLKKTGHLARLELHRQIAVVDCDSLQVEVPLKELVPDLGQTAVREQIVALRQQILDQARQTEQTRSEAQRLHEEYQHSLNQQRERARQFDTWLSAIGRVKVGDDVPIALRPGKGKVIKVDLAGLRATVETGDGQKEISIQDLFPQTGPFAPRHVRPAPPPPQRGRPAPRPPREEPLAAPRAGQPAEARQAQPQRRPEEGYLQHEEKQPDRPMRRGHPQGAVAQTTREALLAVKPGQQVFVIPFNKRATLIRIEADRDQAVVQSGVFEMELPLADLEPLHAPPQQERPAKPRQRPDKGGQRPAQRAEERTQERPAQQAGNVEPDKGGQTPQEAAPAEGVHEPPAAEPKPGTDALPQEEKQRPQPGIAPPPELEQFKIGC